MSFLLRTNVALAPLLTLKTGGLASYFVTVTSVEDLEKAVAFAEQKKLPFYILAGGSNLLAADDGYKGLIIHMDIKGVTYGREVAGVIEVTVGAGEVLDTLIAETVRRGLWGLENLSAIPGSVGATPVQNVGAYGVEVADVISSVSVFDTQTKQTSILSNQACNFSYRHSIFKENSNLIIVAVTYVLSSKPNPKISYADLARLKLEVQTSQAIRKAVITIRAGKFPDWTVVGTAGSFFKNPIISLNHAAKLIETYAELPTYPVDAQSVKISLGYVLDKICGLRGYREGLVQLSEAQALVLIAHTGATSMEIEHFAQNVSDLVFAKTGVVIEREVTHLL